MKWIVATACLIAGLTAFAQTPGASPKFEVASVRMTTTPDRASVAYSGSHVTIGNYVLKDLIARAYGTETYLVKSPDWTTQARVIIQALMPGDATKKQVPEMLKALLEERFHLAAHRAITEEPAFALIVTKAGPKLNPPRDLNQTACANWSDNHDFDEMQACSSVRQLGGQTFRSQLSTGGPSGPAHIEITSDGDLHEEFLKITMQQLARQAQRALCKRMPRPSCRG